MREKARNNQNKQTEREGRRGRESAYSTFTLSVIKLYKWKSVQAGDSASGSGRAEIPRGAWQQQSILTVPLRSRGHEFKSKGKTLLTFWANRALSL